MNALVDLGYWFLANKLTSERDSEVLAQLKEGHEILLERESKFGQLVDELKGYFAINFDLDQLDVEDCLAEVRAHIAREIQTQAQKHAKVLNRYLELLHQCADAIGDENLEVLPAQVKALVELRDERDRLWTYLFAFREVFEEHLGQLPSDKHLSEGELHDAIIARLKSDRAQINELIATAEGQKRAIVKALSATLATNLPDGRSIRADLAVDRPWEELAEFLVAQIVSLKAKIESYERVGQGGEKPPTPIVIQEKVEAKKPAPAPRRSAKPSAPPAEEAKPIVAVSQAGWPYLTSPEIMLHYVRLRANGAEHGRACSEANVHPSERTLVSGNFASTVQRARERTGIDREEYFDALLKRWQLRASIRRAA